jgi:tetratricopeptide (TPR) repeat protein
VKCGLEKSVALYYNISICYENLGFVSLAIAFLEEACTLNSAGQNNVLRFQLYNSLGINYACTGHLQRAKALLDKAYEIAVSDLGDIACDDTKTYMGMVLINYGYLFRMAKKWNIALENLNRAMIYIPKDNAYYLEALYQKIRCLILMGNSLACADLLNEGASLSKGDEIYVAMFEALRILISPNDETARYLETKILASLLENNVVYPALDYAMFLRDYYGAKIRGFKIRALEMSNIACNILNRMHEGGVIE